MRVPFPPHPHLAICCLSDNSCLQVWQAISFWFWFAFLWWLVMLSIFSCVCWSSVCLPWGKKMSIQILCPFIKWVVCLFLCCCCFFPLLSDMSSLYTLNINPLSNRTNQMSYKYFLPLGRWPFNFVDGLVSLAVQKLLSLIQSCLLNFAFVSTTNLKILKIKYWRWIMGRFSVQKTDVGKDPRTPSYM